ncbi:MAG TPA: hypothetical protein VG733_02760 [Chthoniobacteraceae bacterium]|nr:hypothetical protein [Chthoniobacteraceae bacterium]
MIKYLAVIAMTVAALSLGACAHKEAAQTTTTASASKGYAK